MQADPFCAPLMVMQGSAASVAPLAPVVPVSEPVVELELSGKQSAPEVGQSPQLPRTMSPWLSTAVAHQGVRYPPAVVHSVYVTPRALKGNMQAEPFWAPLTVMQDDDEGEGAAALVEAPEDAVAVPVAVSVPVPVAVSVAVAVAVSVPVPVPVPVAVAVSVAVAVAVSVPVPVAVSVPVAV